MFIGPGGVGKSSLRRGLMNLALELNPNSTILAEMLKVRFHWARATLSADQASKYWIEITEDDEIRELAGQLQKVVNLRQTKSRMFLPPRQMATRLFRPIESVAVWLGNYLTKSESNRSVPNRDYAEFIKKIKDETIDDIIKETMKYTQEESPPEGVTDEPEVLIHIWDCGGQQVFLDVIPAFLTARTIFLLLFNAAEQLNRSFSSVSRQNGDITFQEDHRSSAIDLLFQWMAAIHAQAHLGAAGPNEPLLTYPKIIPVGTHADQLASEECDADQKKAEILDQLDTLCRNKAFYDLLLDGPGVIVDNTTAGKGDNEDPGFQKIRKSIQDLASSSLTVPTPINWVLFRKIFQEASKRGSKPVFTMQECLAIAKACDIPVDSLPSVLNFYHQYGVLLYYGTVPTLREIVIANPQWLVDQFGKLLAIQGSEPAQNERGKWKLLRENGILVEQLYRMVWSDSGVDDPQALMDLLEHFLLAAPIKTIQLHHYIGREYFVPCMLTLRPEVNTPLLRKQKPVKKAAPLHLVFNTGYVPPGFFVRLATSLTKNEEFQLLFSRGIHRNSITLEYGKIDKIDEITITEWSNSVQIDVVRCANRKCHISPFAEICHELLSIISSCCSEVREWMPLINISVAFQCMLPTCESSKHFVTFNQDNTLKDSYLRCERGNICTTSPEQQYWLRPGSSHKVHDHIVSQ